MTTSEKQFIHHLCVQYYSGRKYMEITITDQNGKAKCLGCGFKRKLGLRGAGRGKCKKCRKGV